MTTFFYSILSIGIGANTMAIMLLIRRLCLLDMRIDNLQLEINMHELILIASVKENHGNGIPVMAKSTKNAAVN